MSTRQAVGAFFDVDGTLTASDIVRDHVSFRRSERAGPSHLAWMSLLPLRGLGLLLLDRINRHALNRIVHAWYRGFRPEELERWAAEFQAGPGLERVFEAAWPLLERHAREGHRIVLVSGSLDLILDPLALEMSQRLPGAPELRVEAVRLRVHEGHFTGEMLDAPLGGEEKARRVEALARQEGLDLADSHAYGDSIWDLPLLEAVGSPTAVNPDRRLRRLANERDWPILDLD